MPSLPSQPPRPLSHHFKCVMEDEPNEGNPCFFSDPLSYLQSNNIPKSLPGLESDGWTYVDSLALSPASVLCKDKYIQL